MATGKQNQGGGIGDEETRSEEVPSKDQKKDTLKKSEDKRDDLLKQEKPEIEKKVAKVKRERVKKEIVGDDEVKPKRRRRKRRKKTETETQPAAEAKPETGVQEAPINPFADSEFKPVGDLPEKTDAEEAVSEPIAQPIEPVFPPGPENPFNPSIEPENPFAAPEPPQESVPAYTPQPVYQPPEAPSSPEPINPFAAPPQAPQAYDSNPAEHEHLREEMSDSNQEEEVVSEPDPSPVEDFSDVEPINPFADLSSDQEDDVMPKAEDVVQEEREEEVAENSGLELEDDSDAAETQSPDVVVHNDNETESELVKARPVENSNSDADVLLVDDSKNEDQGVGEVDEFKESFWDILEGAGFTRDRIIGGVVIFAVVLLLILFLALGWYRPILNLFSGSDAEEVVSEEDVSEVEGSPLGVISSYIIGLEHTPVRPIQAVPISSGGTKAGLDAGFAFGEPFNFNQQKFVKDIQLLRSMQNLYETDVYGLLDLASDRRAALDQHISDYERLVGEGEFALEVLEADIALLENRFDSAAARVEEMELAFFDNTNALLGDRAYNNLQSFIEASKTVAEIKAEFNAKITVRDQLLNSLSYLIPRQQDIVSNKEALIKGVRVFDVPGSDIEAIIRLDQAE